MKNYFLPILIPIVFAACKKKEIEQAPCDPVYYESFSNDTILPSPYIMAYPGSVWNYDNGTTTTCDSWEQVGLVATSSLNNCKAINTTYTVLPQTSFGFVHGANVLEFQGADQDTKYLPLVATTPGYFYNEHTVSMGSNANELTDTREVTELLDSMTVAGVTYYDVIHVYQYHKVYYYHVYSGPQYTKDCYYANGVGLIRSEETINLGTPVIRNLVSYVIGPH